MSASPLKRSKTKPLPPEAVAEVGPDAKARLPWREKLKAGLKWLTVAMVLIAGVSLFRYLHLEQYLQQEQLQAWLAPLGPWTPLVFILLCVVTMLLVVIPFGILCAVASLIFGTAWGTFWSVIGGTIAGTVVFLVARLLGSRFVQQRLSHFKHWDSLNQRLEKEGFYYLFLIRALCLFPFNLVNYVSAVTAVQGRAFVFSTLFGLIPSAFIYNYGTSALVNPEVSLKNLVLLGMMLVLFILLPVIYRHLRRSRTRLQQRLAIQQVFQNPPPVSDKSVF